MSQLEDHVDRSFLAEEFLTWLWWRCETGGGTFSLPGFHDHIGIAIEDDLLLRGEAGLGVEGTFRGGVPTRAPEAAAALLGGKRLCRAKLVVATSDREWTLAIEATSFTLRSVRIPPPTGEHDLDLEAFESFEDLAELFDRLYAHFLALRLDPAFARETLPKMRRWASGKGRGQG